MPKKDQEDRMDLLEAYLRDSSKKITEYSIAEHSFYSYRHANRLFKSLKGEPINVYATKIRLQKAAEYLQYSARTVSEIAIEVGYESIASFSKAFKKSYHLSPSNFRKKYKEQKLPILKTTTARLYTVKCLTGLAVVAQKISFKPDLSLAAFIDKAQRTFADLKMPASDFILLWDEDPYHSLFSESRCFLGIEDRSVSLAGSLPLTKGRYAFFDTVIFSNVACEEWHKLAYLILELDRVVIREGTFIEYYKQEAFHGLDHFFPIRIAIPVR